MWHHARHNGEPVTFLLQDSEGEAVEVAAYLDALCRTIRGDDDVNDVARQVYQPLIVYISLLEDPDAEPASVEDEMEALPDEWSPFHLAMVAQHADAVEALLVFHQQHATTVLENLLSESNSRTPLPERDTDSEPGITMEAGAPVKNAGYQQQQQQQKFMECQVRPELGGTIALIEGGDANFDENAPTASGRMSPPVGAEDMPDSIECVTGMLKSFLECLLYEKANQCTDAGNTEGCHPSPGFATRIVVAHCDALTEYYTRFPGLILKYDVLYEVCGGNLTTLCEILKMFSGLLLPVVHGKRMVTRAASSQGSSVNTTPWDTPHAGPHSRGGHTPQQQQLPHSYYHHHYLTQAPFFLSCAAQEHQKLAFLVTWTNYREAMSLERQPPGSARQNREANVLSDFRVSLLNFRKTGYMTPPASLWSGHLFVLSRLISGDCMLERFIDIVEGDDHALCCANMPATFIAAMVAGAVVSAFPKTRLLRLLTQKVETLLVDVPGVFSPLRQYVLLQPANDAERFEELWLAETPLTPAKKFKSRVEMLFFAIVETVLLGAEKLWATPGAFANDGECAKVQHFLQEWLNMWGKFFVSLRSSRQLTAQPRRAASRSPEEIGATATSTTTATTSTTLVAEEHEINALERVCNALPLRLQYGAPPLPAVGAVLYPEAATTDGCAQAEGGLAPNVEADFEAAQLAFSLFAAETSNDTKLKFYGLYKQATVGDINVSKPWLMDTVGRAKWEAWNQHKGMSSEDAKREYVSEYRLLHASRTGTK
ncbi:acyl-CoA binding protein [Trypanosoma grayi]|uniref:acyl-CoA binding protein n=1 Tax=Trypanosoma grayi TaxID=71804 RepID=UPI0004F41974|nr:acyl-CoA binding protein [Trypanosoma grayi]KEG13795.1 acyl-CoA binding protein [Trypanosoma grayi]